MNPLNLRIGVVPSIQSHVSLSRSLKDEIQLKFMESMTLGQALEHQFDTPALFCTYYIEGEEKIPRLSKPCERLVQTKGKDIWISMLAVDYDLPKVDGKKAPWESEDGPWDLLAQLSDHPELWPTAFYSTRHGARLVYALSRALSPHDAEKAYGKLLSRLREVGIEGDENTRDWTRLFALPFITKDDGTKLWEDPTIFVETYPDRLLNPDLLIERQAAPFVPCIVDGDKPDAKQVERILWRESAQSPFHKRAKELLKNNSFAAYLFDGSAADFRSGERDSKINTMAWTVVRTLFGKKGMEEIGPEHAYAVMHRGIAQMSPDEDEPNKDWTDVLWEKTCRIWEAAVDKAELERRTDEEIENEVLAGWRKAQIEEGLSVQGLLAQTGMKDERALLKRNLIVIAGRDNYLLGPRGVYSSYPVPIAGLHGAIEMMGLGRLYGLERFGERVSETDLRREHGVPVQEVVGRLGQKGAALSGLDSEHRTLYVPTYYRRDIEPAYVREVEEWLQVFAGERFDRLADWIAHSQDVPRPICALSLTGPPGAGKSFLAELLGAMFGPGQKNNETVFGQFNFRLKDNPVIHIDEGLENLKGRHIDAKFREFVTGGNLMLSQKNVDDRSYEVYPRVIISANNLDALHHIVASRDLDDDSHAALVERILHLEIDGKARRLVERKRTENWIRGDKLALRHFAWLYENRSIPSKYEGAGRFVVEGDRRSEMLEGTRFNSPLIEAVMRVLIRAIEAVGSVANAPEIDDDGMVMCSASAVSQLMSQQQADFYNLPRSPKGVAKALKRLSNNKSVKHPTRRWLVPLEFLLNYAIETGAKCDRLQQAFKEAHGERALQTFMHEL